MTRIRTQTILWLIVLTASAWALRAPFLEREMWNLDEGSTFTMAQQIREGAVLYRDAVDQRAPLVPYLKAAVFAVAGDWNIYAVHLILALALGVAAFLLYDVAQRLRNVATGVWAALAFTAFAFGIPGPTDGFAAHTEWFLLIFSVLGVWLFVRLYPTGGFYSGALIGLTFAAAVLCKQPGLFDYFVVCVLIALLARSDPASRSRLGHFWIGSLVGMVAAGTIIAVYFWQYGAWRDLVYYAWTYNLKFYIPEVPRLQRLGGAYLPFRIAFEFAPALALLSIAGCVALLPKALRSLGRQAKEMPLLAWLILGWCASGLAATMLSGRHYEHYGIQIIPGISLACGWMIARFIEWLRQPGPAARWPRWAGWITLSGLLVWATVDVVHFRQRVTPHDDPNNRRLGDLIRRYCAPHEPMLVWGYFPDGYLIARRLPSTRFIYPNFLTGLIPWTNLEPLRDTRYAVVPGAWDAFWRDYRTHPPAVILDTEIRGYNKYPLLTQSRLRDEAIDRFAVVQKTDTERFFAQILRRLDEPQPALTSTDFPVDVAVQLHAQRVASVPDLVAVTVVAPAHGADVTLRLGHQPYRRLRLPAAAPVEVTFYVRISDLAPTGAGIADAVLIGPGGATQSAPLDLIRWLVLDPQPAASAPMLTHGNQRYESILPNDSSKWRSEPSGQRMGWRTDGPFTLEFIRPEGMDILQFAWQPAALRRDAARPDYPRSPQVFFTPNGGVSVPLPQTCDTGNFGRETISVDLPRSQPGRLSVQWKAPDAAEVVSTSVWLGELRGFAQGPLMVLTDRTTAPSLATALGDSPWIGTGDGVWAGPAPSRLLYPRTRHVHSLVFDYGILDRPYLDRPGNAGVEAILEVNFLHRDGHRENLLSEALRPAFAPASRGRHHARVSLPDRGEGDIEFKFNPIPLDNPNAANTYLSSIRVQGPGPDLIISPDRVLMPTESSTSNGEPIRTWVNGRWIAHAPGHVVYVCPADLRTVNFGFGIEEGAYWGEDGSMRSNGIDVFVEFRDDSEKPIELFRRRLDPHSVAADRGVQIGHIELPGRPGRIVFHMGPGPNNDLAYDWSYWTDFTGSVTAAPAAP